MAAPGSAAWMADTVGEVLGEAVAQVRTVHGGDVASSFRVELVGGRVVFAKARADAPPGFFTTEAAGLAWLRAAGAVPVPEVLSVGDDPAHLLLEWVEEGSPTERTEAELGRGLATLHRAGSPVFGREDLRPTGSRGLPNDPAGTWAEFYATRRLEPLADMASATAALEPAVVRDLHRLADRLPGLLGDPEPPARLHGDLWAGNRLVDRSGRSWLIDPACFGGHREFDLAMMALFGGFGPDVVSAYDEVHPLQQGWQERVALHQVAPLVVHAVKFGGGYADAAARAIRRYL